MIRIALRMLTGDTAKYVGLVGGVAFAVMLMAQQASIFASEAVVRVDDENNRLQMTMKGMSSYEAAADPKDYYRMSYPEGDQVLEARPREERRAKAEGRSFSAAAPDPLEASSAAPEAVRDLIMGLKATEARTARPEIDYVKWAAANPKAAPKLTAPRKKILGLF